MAVTLDFPDLGRRAQRRDYVRQWLAQVAGRVRQKMLNGYRGLIRLYASPGLGTLRLVEIGPLETQDLYPMRLGIPFLKIGNLMDHPALVARHQPRSLGR